MKKNTALKHLYCFQNQLTSLDVKSNSALKYLHCSNNQLTVLDISHNINLENLNIMKNKFTTETLNALFNALIKNTDVSVNKRVYIGDNPGTDDCDKSIAENKGWIVY